MKVKVLQPMPENGKLFDFKKKTQKIEVRTTYDASHDYAVIISGGYNNNYNWARYWNDCSAIYSALVNVYNYSPSHIYVIMADGTSSGADRVVSVSSDWWGNLIYTRDSSPLDLDGNGTNDIQYSATKSNISTVFNTLSNILDEDDHLFVFTTDHGGQTSANDVYLYLWGQTMTDDELANELDKVDAGKITVTMGQCNSGGFIDELSGNERVISTACAASQNSNATADATYDEYLYHWISAIAGETPYGAPVDADDDNDGWISMREAFEYAANADAQPETPQYFSSPTGLGCQVRLSANSRLSGPSLICSSGTFTLHNRPPNCSVNWSYSNNLTPVTTGSTSITLRKNNGLNGIGWVNATIVNNECGNVILPNENVYVGTPVISSISGPTSTPNNQWATYQANLQSTLSAPTDYTWILNPLNGNSVYDYGMSCDIAFYNTGSYQLIAQAQNVCGTSEYYVTGVYVYETYSLMISPNPSTGETVLSIESTSKEKTFDADAEWEYEVYTDKQLLMQKQTSVKGASSTINTSSWKNGIYFIRVIYKDEVLQGKLVVKH